MTSPWQRPGILRAGPLMSTLDLLDDGFPHGTPEGFRAGCRTVACPAAIPCRTVYTRYNGDLSFARRLDGGMSLEAILEQDAERKARTRRDDRAAATADQRAEAAAALKPTTSSKPQPPVARRPARAKPGSRPPALVEDPARESAHAGYAWVAAARTRLEKLGEDARVQVDGDLNLYVEALDRYVDELERWRLQRGQLRAQLTAASARLRLAKIAAGTGLSVGGAIEKALARATEEHRAAAAAYDSARRPVEPERPRIPRRPRKPRAPRELQPHGTNACRARGCERPECIEAGQAYHREWMAQRKGQPIPAEYHGSAYGYQLGCKDRSACPAEISCADASLAEERRRRREAGIPEQAPRVPAGPVREHVRALMAAGMSVIGIAEDAGVSLSGVKTLLYGRSGARKGEMPSEIEAEKAQRILWLPTPVRTSRSA